MRTTDTPVVVGGPVEILMGVVVLGLSTAVITAVISRALDKRRPGGEH